MGKAESQYTTCPTYGLTPAHRTVPPQLFDIEAAFAKEAFASDKPLDPACIKEETQTTPKTQRKAAKYADNIIRRSNYLSAMDGPCVPKDASLDQKLAGIAV